MVKHKLFRKGWVMMVLVFVIGLAMALPALAISDYNAYTAIGNYVFSTDGIGGTRASSGWLLQVIYANGGVIHAPNADGTPGGGDALIDSTTRTVGNLGGAGAFYYLLSSLTDSSTIYIRVWNASTAAAATHYGNSATLLVNNPRPSPPRDWAINSFATTITKPVIVPTLTITPSTTPYKGDADVTLTITSSNNSLTDDTTFTYPAGVTEISKSLAGNTYTVHVGVATNASTGTVTASTGGSGTLTINPPSITLSPTAGDQGWTNVDMTITGTGTHFLAGSTTVAISGTGITPVSTTVNSATQVVYRFNIASDATANARDVTVDTPLDARGTETLVLSSSFTVNAITPVLNINPTSRNFTYTIGGANPADQSVAVSNSGQGNLSWMATDNADWLTINPASDGNGPTNMVLHVNPAGLVAGPYTGTVSVTSNGGNDNITVNLTVTDTSQANLDISTNSITTNYTRGNPNPTATFTVANSGTADMAWTVAENPASNILSLDIADGTIAVGGPAVTVTITFDPAQAIDGANPAFLQVAAPGAIDTPQNIAVTLNVSPAGVRTDGNIDDFEGTVVKTDATLGNEDGNDGYYLMPDDVPPAIALSTTVRTGAPAGSHSLVISSYPDHDEGWRGYGAVYAGTASPINDIHSYQYISFYAQGNGSTAALKIQLKDQDGSNFGVANTDTANLIPLADTSWKQYFVPISAISNRIGTTGDATINLDTITEYQFVITGTAPSGGAIYIDDIRATNSGPQTTLSVAPTSLIYNYVIGGAVPADQSITVTLANGTTWNATETQTGPTDWLSITGPITGGNGTTNSAIHVNIASLPVGTYTGTITITAAGATNRTVGVTLNVTPTPQANLDVSTNSITTNYTRGAANPTATFTVANSGTADMTWTVAENPDSNILALDTTGGTIAVGGSAVTVTVTYDPAQAIDGANPAFLQVAAPGAIDTPQNIAVTLNVSPAGVRTDGNIDDFEGTVVKTDATLGNEDGNDGYYLMPDDVPPAIALSTTVRTGAPAGSHSLVISSYPDHDEGWRGYGAVYAGTATPVNDIHSYQYISFYAQGNGSTAALKVQLKDQDGSNFSVADTDTANLIPLSDTSWQQYFVPVSAISNRIGADGDNTINLDSITEYQFVITGAGASGGAIYIDDIQATNTQLAPVLTVVEPTVDLTYTIGGPAPAVQTITVSNTGTAALDWALTADLPAWLTAAPMTGTGLAANGTAPVALTVNTAGLVAGDYPYTMNFTSSNGGGTDSVTVTLHVTDAPNQAPTAPTLNTPAAGETNVSTTPTFSWNASTDANNDPLTYVVMADETNLLDSPIVQTSTSTSATLPSSLAEGTLYYWAVTVSDGQGGSAISEIRSFTVGTTTPKTEVVIDDYEGVEVNAGANATWAETGADDGYYTFAETGEAVPSISQASSPDIQKGDHSVGVSLTAGSAAAQSKGWTYRGFGGILLDTTTDISAFTHIKFWMKGDGTQKVNVKLQIKDATGNVYAVADNDTANLIPISPVVWTEYSIPVTALKAPTGVTAPLDTKNITEYQFVFTGVNASAAVGTPTIFIDYVRATNDTTPPVTTPVITSISPSKAAPGDTIVIKGTNLGALGGTVKLASAGISTVIQAADTDSLVRAWSADEITFVLPTLSSGSKDVSITTSDSQISNSLVLEILAAGDVSYNWPNPFNPKGGQETTIVFSPKNATKVGIYIFDTTARNVKKLFWEAAVGGDVTWNGRNFNSEILGDGVYLYRVVNEADKSILGKGKILIINK